LQYCPKYLGLPPTTRFRLSISTPGSTYFTESFLLGSQSKSTREKRRIKNDLQKILRVRQKRCKHKHCATRSVNHVTTSTRLLTGILQLSEYPDDRDQYLYLPEPVPFIPISGWNGDNILIREGIDFGVDLGIWNKELLSN